MSPGSRKGATQAIPIRPIPETDSALPLTTAAAGRRGDGHPFKTGGLGHKPRSIIYFPVLVFFVSGVNFTFLSDFKFLNINF